MGINQVPDEWIACTIADIAEVNPKKLNASPEKIAGFIPMSHIPDAYFGLLKHEEKPWEEIRKSYTNFQNNDVIFAKVTPCFENGKASIVYGLPNGIGAGSSELYVLRPYSPFVSKRFVYSIIKSQTFMTEGAANMTGAVGLRRVPRAFVENFTVNLPPLAEQKVIADKLDTLLAQVEITKARLDRIPDILKRFRQSVLAAAVSGKLTEEWRDSNGMQEAPNIAIDEVVESSFYGPRFGKNEYTSDVSGVPTIRTTDMANGLIEVTEKTPRVAVPSNKLELFKVNKNDLLITRTGSIGVMALFTGSYEAIPSAYLIRFRFKPDALPKYIYYCLTSPVGQSQMGLSATAITQPNINAKSIRAIQINFPNLVEQIQIVKRVEDLFSYADSIEQKTNAALALVNRLTQSILAKAFRGELTALWRADNPDLISGKNSAEALLEKIKTERERSKPAKHAVPKTKAR